jgi:hypothetical protein
LLDKYEDIQVLTISIGPVFTVRRRFRRRYSFQEGSSLT